MELHYERKADELIINKDKIIEEDKPKDGGKIKDEDKENRRLNGVVEEKKVGAFITFV